MSEKKKPGPKPGSKRLTTIRKEAVAQEIRERVMKNADALFNAQLSKAVGSVRIFRVDEVEEKGKISREHVLVTDPDEMKMVLDGNEGMSGTVGESYYFVTEVPPDNKAIDSMLDRTFGKAAQSINVTNEPNERVVAERVFKRLVQELGYSEDQGRKEIAKLYPTVAIEELGAIG
jgi:hypothetical protein